MFEQICGSHATAIVLTLLLALVAIGSGKGLGILFSLLLKRILGKEAVTVNVGLSDRAAMDEDRTAMAGDRVAMASDRQLLANRAVLLAGHACLIPEDCPKHAEEVARSLKNEKDIAELENRVHENQKTYWKEFKAIRRGITCIINGLLAKQIIDPHDLPREDL